MSGMLSAARRRKNVIELVMVMIYVVLTAYSFVCQCPPRIAVALREVAAPFQIKSRARKTAAERSAMVWRSLQFETNTPPLSR